MEFSRRRRLVWTLTALGIALFISTVTTVATDVAAIEAWATRNATGFPRAYDQVAALPVQYQKALLGVLPPDVVADLWRTHLERIIATDNLSVEQQAYLLKVRQQLTPDAFAEATATERFKTLCNEGRDVLGPERAAYFTRLDRGRFALAIGPLGAWPIMIDAGYRLQQSRPYRAVAEAIVPALRARQGACECTPDSWCNCDFCFGTFNCQSCCWTPSGCGCFWIYACTGTCP